MVHRLVIGTALLLLVSASAAFAADGGMTFKAQCAKCHGASGLSDTPIGKSMKVPQLAGDAKVKAASEADLAALVKKVGKHPDSVKKLDDESLNAVATFVKELAGK